jgi:hypothetical protein
MKGITATVIPETISESPYGYKNIFSVMRSQEQSIKEFKYLKPIINWKGH